MTDYATTELDAPTATATADLDADDLLRQLNNSGSATIYVDLAGVSQDTNVVTGDVHVEFDVVRQLFAIRRANSEELAEAEAAAS